MRRRSCSCKEVSEWPRRACLLARHPSSYPEGYRARPESVVCRHATCLFLLGRARCVVRQT
jgi:hypothetical protein